MVLGREGSCFYCSMQTNNARLPLQTSMPLCARCLEACERNRTAAPPRDVWAQRWLTPAPSLPRCLLRVMLQSCHCSSRSRLKQGPQLSCCTCGWR
jgi:hypothetical protein